MAFGHSSGLCLRKGLRCVKAGGDRIHRERPGPLQAGLASALESNWDAPQRSGAESDNRWGPDEAASERQERACQSSSAPRCVFAFLLKNISRGLPRVKRLHKSILKVQVSLGHRATAEDLIVTALLLKLETEAKE